MPKILQNRHGYWLVDSWENVAQIRLILSKEDEMYARENPRPHYRGKIQFQWAEAFPNGDWILIDIEEHEVKWGWQFTGMGAKKGHFQYIGIPTS